MIFVDTSAFLAVENRRDSHHSEALRFKDLCLKTGKKLITSDYVLDECYTIIRVKAGYHVAEQFGEALRASRLLLVEHLSPERIEEAWAVFKKFKDHDFSFTDCTSFALMERLKIRSAFTFDSHFKEYPGIIPEP